MELADSFEDVKKTDHNEVTQTNRKRRNPFNTQLRKDDEKRRRRKRARIIARNISYKVREDTLLKHFSQWGNVEELNLLKRTDGKLVGCAFVQYSGVSQASKAILKGNNIKFFGRPMYIDWALGKDEYLNKKKGQNPTEPDEKRPKIKLKEQKEEELGDCSNNEVCL